MQETTINKVFYWYVDTLKHLADKWQMTHEQLFVWVFCVIGPSIFLLMMVVIAVQLYKLQARSNRFTHPRIVGSAKDMRYTAIIRRIG